MLSLRRLLRRTPRTQRLEEPAPLPCPICGLPLRTYWASPRNVCGDCSQLTTDERGRPMRFHSDQGWGIMLYGEYLEGEEWVKVDTNVCWINGKRCTAHEYRMGGIMVLADPSPGSAG